MKPQPLLYKIYSQGAGGQEYLSYVGRTRWRLTQRLRNHFQDHPLQMGINIERVTRIEYALCSSVADMYVFEVILINQLKPLLNNDDKAKDELTVTFDLSFLEWIKWENPALMTAWKERDRLHIHNRKIPETVAKFSGADFRKI